MVLKVSTINILLKSDFSSDLTNFLAIIEGPRLSQKDIKLRRSPSQNYSG